MFALYYLNELKQTETLPNAESHIPPFVLVNASDTEKGDGPIRLLKFIKIGIIKLIFTFHLDFNNFKESDQQLPWQANLNHESLDHREI